MALLPLALALLAPAAPEPVQLDVLLFEDAAAAYAFGGFRERGARVEALLSPSVPECDLRAPVVDGSDGSAAALGRLAELSVELDGAVLLVQMATDTGEHGPAILETVRSAAPLGVRAILVAPSEGSWPFDLVDPLDASAPAPVLPVIRIRRSELELLRARLRARRVRGADGKTETVRVGPGPVEAHVVVRSEAERER